MEYSMGRVTTDALAILKTSERCRSFQQGDLSQAYTLRRPPESPDRTHVRHIHSRACNSRMPDQTPYPSLHKCPPPDPSNLFLYSRHSRPVTPSAREPRG